MNIQIEQVRPEMASSLRKLCVDTFTETYASQNTEENLKNYLESNFNLSQLKQELDNPESTFYFIRTDGSLAGYLKVNVGRAQTEIQEQNSLEIERIYILNAYKGQKLGQALLEKAVEQARDQAVDFIWLGVWDQNTNAIGFYTRFGFEPFDTHAFMLGDEEQTDVMMRLVLQ